MQTNKEKLVKIFERELEKANASNIFYTGLYFKFRSKHLKISIYKYTTGDRGFIELVLMDGEKENIVSSETTERGMYEHLESIFSIKKEGLENNLLNDILKG